MSSIVLNATFELIHDQELQSFIGVITLGGVSFNYSLFSLIDISEHAKFIEKEPFDEFREAICLEISIDGEVIELDEDEWKTFYGLVCKSINEIFLHEMKVDKSCAVVPETNPLFRINGDVVIGDTPIRVISRPKFRCNLLIGSDMEDAKEN